MNKKVAIVIPCYNYGKYIEETIESCLASTYTNIEILVVDDGSTDLFTIEKLKDFDKHPKIRVLRKPNGGLSSARNHGFKNTDAEYVLTLDADDKIAPTFIEKAVWLLERKPEYSYVYCLVQLFGEQNHIWETSPFDFDYLKYRNIVPATIVIRNKDWLTIGGYDEAMRDGYEDWEFIIRLAKNQLIGYHFNEVLFYYRKHHGSMLSGSKKKHRKLVKYIREKNKEVYKPYSIFVFILLELNKRFKKLKVNVSFCVKEMALTRRGRFLKKIFYFLKLKQEQHQEILTGDSVKEIIRFPRQTSGKLKILIILPWLKVGGVETVFLNLMRQLKESVDFYVVTTENQSKHPWEKKFEEVAQEIQHLGMFLEDDRERLIYLKYLIKSWKIEIVHLSNSRFGYRVVRSVKESYPSITIIDTLHMEEPWSTWDYFRFSIPYDSFIDRRVVLTKYQQDRLLTMTGNQNISVIPNGIQLEDYDFKVKSVVNKIFHIGFIGRLTEQKQPLVYLAMAKLAKEKGLPFQFYLIGDGELLAQCIKYVKQNNLAEYVIIQKFTDDINTIFKKIDILCIPSLLEGLPITGLEAMISGVPIVATNVPGWKDLITSEENGILAESNPEELLLNIEKLYNDMHLYNLIKSTAKDEVIKYSNEKMAENYLNQYLAIKGETGDCR